MDLGDEAGAVRAQGMSYTSFPIFRSTDSKVRIEVSRVFGKRYSRSFGRQECPPPLPAGNRTQPAGGSVSTCQKGNEPGGAAIDLVSEARGVPVRETAEQRDWIDHHATALPK